MKIVINKLMVEELNTTINNLVDNPLTCTAEGAARANSMRDMLGRSLLST